MADLSDALELEAQVSADLVARIGHGDRTAEDAMVRRYARGLLYLLRRRTGDTELARDIRQETFQIALSKLRASQLEEPQRLAAYLRGIALNLVRADSRKKARRATSADTAAVAAAADETPGPFDQLSRAQTRATVLALLGELRVPRDREILLRTYLREEDKDTVCAALDIDAVHFNKVLFRAKERFRELLSGDRARSLRVAGGVRHSAR